jgi:hypothetical protein
MPRCLAKVIAYRELGGPTLRDSGRNGTRRLGCAVASAGLLTAVVVGCGSAVGASTSNALIGGNVGGKLTEQGCVDQWNSADNQGLRQQTAPPNGPAKAVGVDLSGDYVVYVGITQPTGSAAGSPPPPSCYIYFRFPGGDGTKAALISVPAPTPPGRYIVSEADVSYGVNTDVTRATSLIQDASGRLKIVPESRPSTTGGS